MSDTQRAIDKDQARAKIAGWVNEYTDAISDHKLEAIALADAADFERGKVEALFDDAEDLRAIAKAEQAKRKREAEQAREQPCEIKRRPLIPKAEPLPELASLATKAEPFFRRRHNL